MGSPERVHLLPRGRRDGAVEAWRRRPWAGTRIETARLVLRLYRPQDFEPLHALSSSPCMWTYSERGAMAREESWARLLRHSGHWSLHGFGIFALEEKTTGAYVGEAGLADFHRGLGGDFDPFPESCWAIRPDRQGRGYATEAARAALAWMEARRAARRTVCLIHEDNEPSLRVAQKLGYVSLRAIDYRGYRALLLQRGGLAASRAC